jgi:hypothetical protein
MGRISIFNGAHCLLIESICLGNGGRDSWIGCGGVDGGGEGACYLPPLIRRV